MLTILIMMESTMTHYRVFTVLALALMLTACGGAEDRKAAYMQKAQQLYDQGNYEKARLEYKNVIQIDPKDVQAHYKLGQVMEKLRNWRAAAGEYLRVIELDDKNVDARIRMGQFYLLSKALDKAAEMADKAVELAPDNADALAFRGTVRAQQGDQTAARADAEAALKIDPRHVGATALLASLYLRDKDLDKAVETLEDGIKANPEDVSLRTLLAGIYARTGKKDEAVALLERVIELEPEKLGHRIRLARFEVAGKDLDKAEKVLRDAVKAFPDDTKARLALIEFIAGQRSGTQAEKELEAFIEAEPDNFELRFALGKLYIAARAYGKAMSTWQAIVERDGIGPNGLRARTLMAELDIRKRDFDAASSLLETVLKENAHDQKALSLRGDLALLQNRPDDAINDFRAALRDNPNSIALQRQLARAHVLNKNNELAEDALKKAIELAPRDVGARTDYIQLLAAMGKTEALQQQLDKLIQQTPRNLAVLEALFKAQARKRDWDSAALIAERIKRERPDQAAGYYFAGLIDQAQKNFEDSIPELEKAVELAPDTIQPLTQLVKSYLALKRADDASARLDQVLAGNPENFVAWNLKGEIQLLKNQPDDAIPAFNKAIEVKSDWPTPYRNLASAYARKKDHKQVIATFEKGIEATRGAPALVMGLASLYEQDGEYDKAIKLYEEVMLSHPESNLAANNLAMLLVDNKDDAASKKRALQLIEPLKSHKNPSLLDTVGWVLYRNGNAAEAVDYIKRAIEARAEPLMHYHLGMVYLQMGDKDKAREELKLATGEGVKYPGLDKAKAALKKL